MKQLTKVFFTGLFVFIPFTITVYILYLIIKLGDGIARPLFIYLSKTYGFPLIPGMGFILVILIILICGLLVKNIFGKQLLSFFENLVYSLPIAGKIYKSVKDISNAFIGSEKKNMFKKAVLVDYPMKGVKAIGFLTNEKTFLDTEEIDYISVFIPTTPNPTSGFFLMYKKNDIKILDIPIEQALKIIISAGVVEKNTTESAEKKIKKIPTKKR